MKTCPECSGPLVPLSSIDRKKCGDCKLEYPWVLKPGQKALAGERVGFVTEPQQTVTQTQHTDGAG